MDKFYNRPYFFDNGIRFECRQCGKCCTGAPGTIYVGKDEIDKIAEFLQIPVSRFIDKYLYPYKDNHSIFEDNQGCCLFYKDGCRIYPVRPVQCKTYPFWFENLRSETRWRKVEKECPGIGKGNLFPKEKILEILDVAMVNADSVWPPDLKSAC